MSRSATPVRHDDASQVERAYRSIKAGIIAGRYRPGTPMSEPLLAAEHGMSRTPVREGLSRLHHERYLDHVARHGYFVARVTVESIHDTFDVRRLLEGDAAGRAATLATPGEIAHLRVLARQPPPAEDYRQAEVANARFHLAIASAARNGLATELIERCLAHVDRFMSLGVSFGPFQQGAQDAHLAIVDAIEARDADAAKARMEAHLDCGSARMKDLLLRGDTRGFDV
jgi:DNA-binding GntR family transcriptional regulator